MNSSKYSVHFILMQILTAKYLIIIIIAVIVFIWPSEQQRISPEEDEDQNSNEHSIGNHADQNIPYLRFMAHGFLLSSLDCCWKLQLLPLFFKCELDSPFLNILKLWSHLQISPCFALGHKIMSLLSSFVLFCSFFLVQEELRKMKACNKNRWLVSYYKRICKQETQSQFSENLQFYLFTKNPLLRACKQVEAPSAWCYKRKYLLPWDLWQQHHHHEGLPKDREIFINNCVCKTTELLLKVWILSQTTTEIWILFLWSEKREGNEIVCQGSWRLVSSCY